MDTEKILRVLYSQNPWWVAKRPEETINVPEARRDVYTELENSLKFERITALVGMRRVGKTTLLMQLIKKLIQRVNPLQVLYLSADSVEFQSVELPIKEAFTVYLEKIAPKDTQIYFFVDEAHFSSNWALELKNIWDRHKPKVFVTGSAALTLLKRSKESLAGRVVTYNLPPLGLTFTSLSITREDSGNSRNRWSITNLSLFKLPVDNLCPNSREGRTRSFVRFQFFSDGEDLFNQMLRGFSPDLLWGTTLVFKTFNPILFISLYLLSRMESQNRPLLTN